MGFKLTPATSPRCRKSNLALFYIGREDDLFVLFDSESLTSQSSILNTTLPIFLQTPTFEWKEMRQWQDASFPQVH